MMAEDMNEDMDEGGKEKPPMTRDQFRQKADEQIVRYELMKESMAGKRSLQRKAKAKELNMADLTRERSLCLIEIVGQRSRPQQLQSLD